MAAPIACNYDADCPSVEICFRNVTWREDGCGCSTYYGFKKNPETQLCTDFDATAYLIISFSSFIIHQIVRLHRAEKMSGVLASTCLFTSMAALTTLLNYLFLMLSTYTPIYSPIVYSDSTNPNSEKAGVFSHYERAALILSGLFGIFSVLNIPLYWVEVAERSKRLQAKNIQNINKYKKPLYIFQFIFGMLMIIMGLILGNFFIIAIFVVLITIIIGAIYIYSMATLKSLFQPISKDSSSDAVAQDQKGIKILDEFRFAARFIISGLFISGVFIGLYGVLIGLFDWKELAQEGSINIFIVTVLIGRSGFAITSIGLELYIHKRIQAITKKDVAVATSQRDTERIKSDLSSREFRIGSFDPQLQGSFRTKSIS